jgi:hypothetical protein
MLEKIKRLNDKSIWILKTVNYQKTQLILNIKVSELQKSPNTVYNCHCFIFLIFDRTLMI